MGWQILDVLSQAKSYSLTYPILFLLQMMKQTSKWHLPQLDSYHDNPSNPLLVLLEDHQLLMVFSLIFFQIYELTVLEFYLKKESNNHYILFGILNSLRCLLLQLQKL